MGEEGRWDWGAKLPRLRFEVIYRFFIAVGARGVDTCRFGGEMSLYDYYRFEDLNWNIRINGCNGCKAKTNR